MATAWGGARVVARGHRLRRRTQTVVNYVEDAYLRDDVPCGSALCTTCDNAARHAALSGARPPLGADASHYLVPDARALVDYLDFFESPEAVDVVMLASEVKRVHARGNARLSRAIRNVYNDRRRSVILFANEHCRATSVLTADQRRRRQRRRSGLRTENHGGEGKVKGKGAEALSHPVLRAAAWYAGKVRGKFPVVVLSDTLAEHPAEKDRLLGEVTAAFSFPPALEIVSAAEYFPRFHAENPAALGLYESVRVAQEDAAAEAEAAAAAAAAAACMGEQSGTERDGVEGASPSAPASGNVNGRGAQLYAQHLPPAVIAEGIAEGDLIQGTLRVSKHVPEEAVVTAGAIVESSAGGGGQTGRGDGVSVGDVLIPSRTLRNRAFDGDVVAVRLLPRHRWVAAKSQSLITAETAGDEDEEENEENDRVGKHSEEEEGADGDEEMKDRSRSIGGGGLAEVEYGGGSGGGGAGTAAEDTATRERARGSRGGDDARRVPTRVPTGEVVGITRPQGADFVAIIAEDEERDIVANPHRKAGNSVLAVPMDRRAPKVRLLTRRARDLLGQRLLVRVDSWRAQSRHPEAHVVRVLGPAGDVNAEMAALLAEYQIPAAAPSPGALAELPREGDAWTVSPEDIARRRDLRHVRTCSIDPPGCTDVDDAVSVWPLPSGGWEVGVHIADVSHFVQEGSLLDLEARARGTTVYLVDRRLDMLPALLSENLASLLHGRDRLAVSCVWTLSPNLSVVSVWFGRTVICSRHQLHYYQAQSIYDRAPPPSPEDAFDAEETAAIRRDLEVVVGFAGAMHAARTCVELASAELRFETTSDGQPAEVLTKGEVPMMRVVAELMIAANSATATRIHHRLPSSAFVRRHAPPKADGFDELRALVAVEGVELDASSAGNSSHPFPFFSLVSFIYREEGEGA